MKNRIINVKGAEVTIATRHEQVYISLTQLNAIAITQMLSLIGLSEIKQLSGPKAGKGHA